MSRHQTLEPAPTTPEQPDRHADVPREPCELMRQVDVCRRLGISQDTWIRWRKAGITPQGITYPSGRLRWRRADIDAMVQRKAVEPRSVRRRYFGTANRLRRLRHA